MIPIFAVDKEGKFIKDEDGRYIISGYMQTVNELDFWITIALLKDKNGCYLNGPEQEEAVRQINRLKGVVTEDADYEIIQPKLIEYDTTKNIKKETT